MFLWKNAIVLVGLLALAGLPAMQLVRARWEKLYLARLLGCGALVACFAVSFVPMLYTQIIFGLLMIACFDKRVPMAATYLFFFFWTPAAGALLAIAGAYIAPLTPFMAFAGALLVGYMVHPEHHLRRRFAASDLYMLGFVLLYCICASLRETPTGIARNVATYFVPYVITYHVLSRVRVERPELVMRLLVLGAAAGGLLCIFETIRHWPLYAGIMGVKQEMWMVDAPRTWLERGGIARAYGPYAHPLTGGAMLALALVAGWGMWLARGRSGALFLLCLAMLIGLGSTLSRSGLVAIAVGMMTFQMLRGRYALAVVGPILGFLMIVGLPILGGQDAQFSSTYRLGLALGVPGALGSNMWLGYREAVPLGMLDEFIQGQGIVDLVNVYISLIVEAGIVSLVPYILFLFSAFPHYRAIKRANPTNDQLLLAQTLISIQTAMIVVLALLSSWVAPMQVTFIAGALLLALRYEVARGHAAAAPRRAPLVATMPVDEGERLPALR